MTTLKHNDMLQELDELSRKVVDSVFSVHKELGPGFLEKIYEDALCYELEQRGLNFIRQKSIPVFYKNQKMPTEYKLDLIVEDQMILELKTVEKILPVHEAQVISYMKQCDSPLGFVINFNEAMIKNGIKRVVLSSNNLRAFAPSR